MPPAATLTNPASHAAVLRPIWENASVRDWYYHQIEQMLRGSALGLDVELTRAWVEKPPEIGLAQDATPVTTIERALNVWGRRWTARFDKMSRKIANDFAARSKQATEYSMQQSLKAAGFTVTFSPTVRGAHQ